MTKHFETSLADAVSSLELLDDNSYMIDLPTGDHIAIQIKGNPNNLPVFFVNGMPGSRIIPLENEISDFVSDDVCLISHDERGYGDSSRKPGRSVADTADDIEAISDRLRIKELSLIGISGGGPGALAAAALMGKRILRVALLSSVAPPEYEGWFDGMDPDNQERFIEATQDPGKLWQVLHERTAQSAEDFVEGVQNQFGSSAHNTGDSIKSHALAVKNGPGGWFDHVVALRKPWQVDLGSIASPIRILQGTQDTAVPVGHATWLGEQLSVKPDLIEGAAHTLPRHKLAEIFRWIVGIES
jgi:pimeloyl-ACP methyl ester carboxylesterase